MAGAARGHSATDRRHGAIEDPPAAHAAARVVICGGGAAGLEALLALRALLEVAVEIHLVAPNRRFVYQPLAVAEPFGLAETQLFDIAEVVERERATLHVDALERVEADRRRIRLASGAELPYDALLVAVGARRCDWLQGALHFAGAQSVGAFRSLLERLESGLDQRVCFVGPASIGWSLPLYELALLTASHVSERGIIGAELTIVSDEAEPLAVFGPAAGRMLRDLCADRGVALRAPARAEAIDERRLRLRGGAMLEVDDVVAFSQLQGPALRGLPCDAAGYTPVDEHSRVAGLQDVYAAGDGTSFPVKQGGIATQQADAAAEAIAAQLGAAVVPAPLSATLRGQLLTGIAPIYMRARIAGRAAESFEVAANPLWWPPIKIAGRYLAPYLAGHDPFARRATLADRQPSSEPAGELRESYEEACELALSLANRDADDGHFESALEWLSVIEQLEGVLPPGYLQKRTEWQAHER